MANKMHVKTGDSVVLLTGKYSEKKDKDGNLIVHEVKAVSPKEGKVIVDGVNKIKKHVKPRSQQETGGIVETEGAIYASKVQLYCKKCGKPTRAQHKIEGDKKVRVCAKCGAEI